LLAKRTRVRVRVHRESEEAGYGSAKDLGAHDGVTTIGIGGQGGDPGVGVFVIQAAEALLVARLSILQ